MGSHIQVKIEFKLPFPIVQQLSSHSFCLDKQVLESSKALFIGQENVDVEENSWVIFLLLFANKLRYAALTLSQDTQ